MKKQLRLLCSFIILLFCGGATAQINYTATFDSNSDGWDPGFELTNVATCNGTGALRKNLHYQFANGNVYSSAFTYSPYIGVSNGMPVTVTYKYKVVNYNSGGLPTVPTPAGSNFGKIQLIYKGSANQEYSVAETINSTNQVTSLLCTTQSVTFDIEEGMFFQIGFYTELNNSNSNVYVYIDEVTLTQPELPVCTGMPTASEAIAQSAFVCDSEDVFLSLSTIYSNSGLTFQWQESTDGITYNNVATNGNFPAYTTNSQEDSRWYRAIITCMQGNSVISTPVLVTSVGPCPCQINFPYVEPITLVNFAGINNSSPAVIAGTPAYENFTDGIQAQVTAGQTYPITVKGNTNGIDFTCYFKLYIDFNHNGDFNDDGEFFEIGSVQGSTGTDDKQAIAEITIPTDVLSGITQMRVIKNYNVYPTYSCYSYQYGQAEDYLINIAPLPGGCTTAPQESEIQVANIIVCQGESAELALSNPYNNNEIIRWETSLNNINYTPVQGAVNNYLTITPAHSAYYRAKISCQQDNLYVYTAPVYITMTIIPAPVMSTLAYFCDNVTVADLMDKYSLYSTKWYINSQGGTPLPADTPLVNDTFYYASQTIGGCESILRDGVAVYINTNPIPEPIVQSPQIITYSTNPPKFYNITVEGIWDGIFMWYATEEDALTGQNRIYSDALIPTQPTTFYVVQEFFECRSIPVPVEITAVLNIQEFDNPDFTFHPNPVSDVFNISYSQAINSVEVYNIVGQQVLVKAVNASQAAINVSGLAAGTYMVKVTAAGSTKTVKMVKK